MSKPFFRYEDVPLLLASEGEEPHLIFANNASISVHQPIEAKHFIDDHMISFVLPFDPVHKDLPPVHRQKEDIIFRGVQESGFLMGPPNGPGVKIPPSVEVIKAGSKISYPSGQSLFVVEDLHPGDYHIKVKSTGDTTLRYDEDIQYGQVEVLRNYAAMGPSVGTIEATYYMDSGNIASFFDITGLIDPSAYPPVNEGKVTGSLGDYLFDNAYIRDISFSAEPFQVIQTKATLEVYGNLNYVEGYSASVIDDLRYSETCLKGAQSTVPHAINTKIEGSKDVGISYPLGFSYSITASRSPCLELPVSGNVGTGGEIPVRVTKEAINIKASIRGEKLDPYLKITGKRADLTVKLSDIGFSKDFTDNNVGELKDFTLYGVMDSVNLSVADGGFLAGSVTVKQSYR